MPKYKKSEETEDSGLENFLKAAYQFCQLIKFDDPWGDIAQISGVCACVWDKEREQGIERVNIKVACCLQWL